MNPKREANINAVLQAQKTMFRALQDGGAAAWLELDLTMAQVKALVALRRGGVMPVGGLAELLRVGLPAASLLVDKLVQLGLAERHEDPNDRRRTLVCLTAEGERLLSRLRDGSRDRFRDWLSGMSEEDLAALARGLEALARIAAGSSRIRDN